MMRLTQKQVRILQLILEQGKLTGGEILKLEPRLAKGTVHTTLVRLALDRLVTGEREQGGLVPGHPRVFYSLTAHGRAALAAVQVAEAHEMGLAVTIGGTRI
jgi:DNA-binding PadR family transcriptional regulator